MASLRRLSNSPFWICSFTLPDGRRTSRSTKTSDRRTALRLAEEFQAAANKARQGLLVGHQACAILNDILTIAGQDAMPNETVEAFLRAWVAGKGGNTARRYSGTVDRFLENVSDKKTASLTSIGHKDILSFIEKREQQGVAPKTLSVDVRSLQSAFSLARKLGLVNANPVERALALHPIIVASSQRECFSSEQVAALLSAAEGDWKTMVLLGFYTSARLSDCANMKWENVDLVRGVVDFTPQKTRNKRVVVPGRAELLAHLESLASIDHAQAFLSPSLGGLPTSGKADLSAQFHRVMKNARIDAGVAQGLGVRRFSKLSFHSLRHSFNSSLANSDVSQELRMKLAGHRSEAVNTGYSHLDLPGLKAAVDKLPGLTGVH
jgi:integrase